MEKIIEKILAFLAKKVLAKYKPLIIGITGSQGKTSTRQAIYCVVKEQYRAYTPVKNFNTTLGLPLGVLMSDSPGRSLAGWIKVFLKGIKFIIFRQRYPEVLVLEYGIDRPGEMDELLAIARPKIAVLTGIGLSHLMNFASPEELAKEKVKLLQAVEGGGAVIVNVSDETAAGQLSNLQPPTSNLQILTYSGYNHPEAKVYADDIAEVFNDEIKTEVVVKTPTRVPNFTINAIGEPHVLASIASVAVAEHLKISSEQIKKGLANYKPEPGRLSFIPGAKKSWIIDDTYNASPASTLAALETLRKDFDLMKDYERIAVLGDMKELGAGEAEEHFRIGQRVAELKIDFLICVGPLAGHIAQGAKEAGMAAEKIMLFDTSSEVAPFLLEKLHGGVTVLVKGSQGMRMEKVVKGIMAQPMRANELLCRQDKRWLEK